MIFLLTMK